MVVMSSARRSKSWQIAGKVASILDLMDDEQLGTRLRALARARGLGSDEDAARHVGVSYRQYQRWLSGESEPRTSSLARVAEAFGIPLTELVGEPDKDQLDRIEDQLSRVLLLLGETAARDAEALKRTGESPAPTRRTRRPPQP